MMSSLIPFEGAGHEPELLNPAYLDTILSESASFMYDEVLKPKLTSINGDLAPFLNSTGTYTVTSDDSLSGLCVSLNLGTIINQTTNSVTIQWLNPGYDTLEITGSNQIKAFDTLTLPIEVNSASELNAHFTTRPFRIYPNPSIDQIFIENETERLLFINLFTVDGKLISTISSSNQLIPIDLKEFNSSLIIKDDST